MGSLIMPKHSGQVLEFQTALKVCYDRKNINDGWVENGHATQGIDGFTLYLYQEYHAAKVPGHSTPKKDNSDYTKDAQLPLYFGFMEIADSRSNALRRITPSGIEMYEALLADDKGKIYDLFVKSLETMTFGRNNSACENSDSDVEAPNILLISSIILSGIKRKEYYYVLQYMHENNFDLSNALSSVAYYRKKNEEIPQTAVTYTDAKIIPFWVSLGFLTEDADNRLHINDAVLSQYAFRIMQLRTKNTEPLRIVPLLGNDTASQTIYYGCPGTGKSFEVKKIAEGEFKEKIIWYEPATKDNKECRKIDYVPTEEQKKNLANNVFRTTFHPDYDYATFVGCYKPTKNDAGDLDYKFIPQVFTNAYISALRHPEDPTYLIIEEINRGNCAQIFGDLFQLLDRTNGESDYEIKPDTELAKYLASEGVPSESLKLPANLHLYATMNTSDQSLFPMDSAFKRRWAMEYKPIAYSGTKADKFTVTIGKKRYQWIQFLMMVNEQILATTESEDKQMGEFFIKDSVTEKEFINKVMFYLWNDVCKDYYRPLRVQAQYFMRVKNKLDGEKNDFFTFAELFGEKNEDNRLILEFMLYLESKYKEKHADFVLKVEDIQ